MGGHKRTNAALTKSSVLKRRRATRKAKRWQGKKLYLSYDLATGCTNEKSEKIELDATLLAAHTKPRNAIKQLRSVMIKDRSLYVVCIEYEQAQDIQNVKFWDLYDIHPKHHTKQEAKNAESTWFPSETVSPSPSDRAVDPKKKKQPTQPNKERRANVKKKRQENAGTAKDRSPISRDLSPSKGFGSSAIDRNEHLIQPTKPTADTQQRSSKTEVNADSATEQMSAHKKTTGISSHYSATKHPDLFDSKPRERRVWVAPNGAEYAVDDEESWPSRMQQILSGLDAIAWNAPHMEFLKSHMSTCTIGFQCRVCSDGRGQRMLFDGLVDRFKPRRERKEPRESTSSQDETVSPHLMCVAPEQKKQQRQRKTSADVRNPVNAPEPQTLKEISMSSTAVITEKKTNQKPESIAEAPSESGGTPKTPDAVAPQCNPQENAKCAKTLVAVEFEKIRWGDANVCNRVFTMQDSMSNEALYACVKGMEGAQADPSELVRDEAVLSEVLAIVNLAPTPTEELSSDDEDDDGMFLTDRALRKSRERFFAAVKHANSNANTIDWDSIPICEPRLPDLPASALKQR